MNCEQMTLLISAWLDGETTAQEEKELLAHLEQCADCRALLAQLQTLRASFSDLEELTPAPEGFADRVMEKVRAESKPKVVPLFRRPQVRALMGLAACAVLCVGLMSGTGRKSAENTAQAPAAAPAAMAPEEYVLADDSNGAALYELENFAKSAESPMEKVVGAPEVTTEPAMAPAAPAPEYSRSEAPGEGAQMDALLEDGEQMLPTLTLTVLPEGVEELGELRWEEHEDGTASVYLTDEQVQRLLELLAEQGLEGLLSMPAAADEEKWLVVLREN